MELAHASRFMVSVSAGLGLCPVQKRVKSDQGIMGSNEIAAPSLSGSAWVAQADELRTAMLGHLRMTFGASLTEQDREDLAQETFASMLRYEAQGGVIENPRAFAKSAAWRDARDLLQKGGRSKSISVDPQGAVFEMASDGRDDPERTVLSRAELSRVIEAAERLPINQQLVYRSRFVEQLKPREACKQLGVPRQTYYGRLKAATSAVNAMLESERFEHVERELLSAFVSGTANAEERRRARRLIKSDPHAAAISRELGGLHRGAAAALPLPALESIADLTVGEHATSGLGALRDRIGGFGSEKGADQLAAQLASTGAGRAAGAGGAGFLAKLGLAGTSGKLVASCLVTGAALTTCVVTGVLPAPDLSDADQARPDPLEVAGEKPERVPIANPDLVNRADAIEAAAGGNNQDRGSSKKGDGGSDSVSPAVEPRTPPVEQEFGVPSAAPAAPAAEAPGGAASSDEVQQEFGP